MRLTAHCNPIAIYLVPFPLLDLLPLFGLIKTHFLLIELRPHRGDDQCLKIANRCRRVISNVSSRLVDVKPDTRLEPFVNLAHVQLNTDAITEQGGIAALSSAASSTNVTFATLGMRAEHAFSLGAVEGTLSGMVGWRQACGDTTPQADVSFAGGNAFSIAGTPVATRSAIVEAGLDLSFSPNARVGLSYGGSFTSVSTSHNARASLAVQF